MAKWGDGPGWTIDQAMQVLTVLHPAFRENGYALAVHGSVSRDGKGNDLDLIAVPEELCVTPPEEMERIMCDLIGAQPAQQEPNRGLLGTWSRACVLEDGRGIDMEYRLPAPINRRHEWASSLITLFRDNGYHVEFFSFPERLNANHFDLIALPLTLNATSPEAMDLTVAVGKGAILAVRKGPVEGYAMATRRRNETGHGWFRSYEEWFSDAFAFSAR